MERIAAEMELIDEILSEGNLNRALKRVMDNKGAAGVDKMDPAFVKNYFEGHKQEIIQQIKEMKYRPQPVRRVYIPKANGKKRPLGIPTSIDRVIQQAVAQKLSEIYEPYFSNFSFGFRANRSAHDAVEVVLSYLNEGYEWVIDLDIEKFFDKVNHDKLISTLREHVNDKETLHLIRAFMKAGVMEKGLVSPTTEGVPQGGPLSPVLSNIYLDKLDKELEQRGLRFVRYADDCNILVKSDVAANRVMKSITSWLERKLFLKVSATKTKVVKPTNSTFLGFSFWQSKTGWRCRPANDRKKKLYAKVKAVLVRKKATAKPLAEVFLKLNQIIKGWINYFQIGDMKTFIEQFGQWLRHKVRVVILKQWKKPKTVCKNLQKLNIAIKAKMTDEEIYKVANSRLGLYRRSGLYVVNYLLSPQVLAIRKEDRPGLVNPLNHYLRFRVKQIQM